ncbi:MAG: hypothetical protein IJR92_02470 [Alphaproteobacteria bacterium]|nr:hypothetical protein [Alphaproteobacteria bacterium]
MKVKVKGLVFAGLAAVIFAGNAHAALQAGDLDPTVNPTHVTAKSYVDRVVTSAVDGVTTDLTELEETVAGHTETIGQHTTSISSLNTNKADKATTLAGYGITDAYTKTESDDKYQIKDNLSNNMTTDTGSTTKYPSVAAVETAIEGVTTDLTDLETTVAGHTTAINTINSSDPMTSGITAAKVGNYDSHIANDDIHVTATQKTNWQAATDAVNNATTGLDQRQLKSDSNVATAGHHIEAGYNVGANLKRLDDQVYANETAITSLQTQAADISNKQNKSDSNVATAGNYIAAGHGVGANLTALDTQVKANADSITDIKGGAVMTSGINSGLVGQITTNATNITALQNGKEDKNNKTTTGLITSDANGNITAVAAGTADAYASTSAISSDLTKVKDAITAANGVASGLDGRLTTAEGEIDALQAADTTLQTNIDGKQPLTTGSTNYQLGGLNGTWTDMSTAQQNALNSGIVASTCSANAPCAWINNAWVPIQQ